MKTKYRIDPDQWVSDCGVVEAILRTDRNFIISAPAATGKTYALLNALKKTDTPFVYLASVKALADEIGEQYDLPVHHADTQYKKGWQMVTIPYHLHKFAGRGRLLIWDELNWMISDYGFRPELIRRVKKYLQTGFKQVIVLENKRPKDDPLRVQVKNTERIVVEQSRKPVSLDWVSYTDLKTALLDSISAHSNRSHLVSLFNKSTFADNLVEKLEEEGLQKTEVERYNADEGSRSETVSIMKGDVDGNATRVVLSTYRLGFTTDVGEQVLHIVPFGEARHSSSDITQLANRFRNSQKAPIVRLYYNFPESFNTLDLEYYEEKLRAEAKRRIEIYDRMTGGDLTDEHVERIRLMEGDDLNGHQTEDQQNLVLPETLEVDRLRVQYNILQKYIDNMYASAEDMASRLSRYNIELRRGKSHERIDEPPAVEKEREKQEMRNQVEAYFDNSLTYDHQAGRRIEYLLDYFDRKYVKPLMGEHGCSKSEWSRLTGCISALRPAQPNAIAARDAMYEEFDVGEVISSGEINERVNNINEEHDFLWEDESMSKTKTTQILHRYFEETKRKRVRVPGTDKHKSKRVITGDSPLPFPLKDELAGNSLDDA